jgi:hypothetical protein
MAELLANYEVNSTPLWPRLLRFAIGSVVLHALTVSAALYIPAVRDALNLVNALRGGEYVNEDYKMINPDDVQILRFSDSHGKFQYPPGYFSQNALYSIDPLMAAAAKLPPEAYPEAKIVELYKAEKEAKPSPIPTPSPKQTPEAKPTPSPQPSVNSSPAAATVAQTNTNSATVDAADKEKADAAEKQAAQYGVRPFPKINKKPFTDLLAEGKRMKDSGEIDLSQPIHLEIEAELNADGTLSHIRVIKGPQDPKLLNFALKFVGALSASKALVALDGAQLLNLVLTTDDKSVAAVASTQFESEQRADEKAKGYNLLLGFGQLTKRDEPAATILKSTTVAAKGKQVFVNFKMPRAAAGTILTKQLPSG